MTNNVPESIINFANTIKNLINAKANKTNGVSEITDSNSDDYSHIATMQSGATQQTINDSVNIELGKCIKQSQTSGLIKNDGTIDTSSKENISNKVSSWSGTVTNDHYPSEKLVKDSLDEKVDESFLENYIRIDELADYISLAHDDTTGELVLEFSNGKTFTYMSPGNYHNEIILYDDEDNVLSNKNIRKIDVNGNETTITTNINGVISYPSFRSLFFDGDNNYKKCRYDRRILKIHLDLTITYPPENSYHPSSEGYTSGEEYDPLENIANLNFNITGPDIEMPSQVTYSQFNNRYYEFSPLDLGEYTVSVTNANTVIDYDWYELDIDGSQVSTTVSLTEQNTNIVNANITLIYQPVNFIDEEDLLVDIPVQILWEDEENAYGTEPDNVNVRLLAEGVEVDSILIDASTRWSGFFPEQPLYYDGREINYTIQIDPVTMYSTPSIEGNVYGYVATLTVQTPTETFYVTKIWNDNNNINLARPNSIVMTLKDENQLSVGTVTLNDENSWSSSLAVPTFDRSSYAWTEQGVVAYVQESVTTQGENTIFTNLYQGRPDAPPGGKPPKTPKG